MDDSTKEWIAERDRAFANDDLSWAAKMLPDASSPQVVEAAFHKARHQCLAAPEEKRIESRDWLADRDLSDLLGRPINRSEPLPR